MPPMSGARYLVLPSDRRWRRRLAWALGLALGLGWLPSFFYGHSSLSRLDQLGAEVAELGRKNQALRAENQRLRAEIQLHDEDPLGAVERAAREDLGLIKPGEVVFRIIEEAP